MGEHKGSETTTQVLVQGGTIINLITDLTFVVEPL